MQHSSGESDDRSGGIAVGAVGLLSNPEMRYPTPYAWLILFSSLDVLLTWIILSVGGWEVNPIAAEIIQTSGMFGATLFKFCLVLISIVICETIGRMNNDKGQRLSMVMAAIASIPVWWSLMLLWLARSSIADVAGQVGI